MERGPTSEQLMAEMAWVRRLARALVRDHSTADDVAQDAWVVANERQPSTDRPLRPWLSRVVRNLAHTRKRAEARRDVHEGAAVDLRVVATPAELIERVELHRAIADEVIALAEPYRSTVLLHFFEDLSSVELAQRLGVPEGTVRRRLKVALDQLRDALRERSRADERNWLRALVPLAALPNRAAAPSALPTLIGAFAVKKLVAAVVVVLALGLVWIWHRAPSASTPSASHAPAPLFALDRDDAKRPIPSWMVQAGVAPRTIAGRVIAGGEGVAGATVQLALHIDSEVLAPIATATTTAGGAFDFGRQPAAVFVVSAIAEHHAAVATTIAVADPHVDTEHVVIALGDCHAHVSGSIRDAGGGPIAHARVSSAGLSAVESSTDGTYDLCLAAIDEPGMAHAPVRVEAEGYGALEDTVMALGDVHHDFVLVPEAVLVGRVTVGDQPVAHARVSAEPDDAVRIHRASGWAESDDDGRFRIAGLSPGRFRLSAIAEHLGTAVPVPAIARSAATSRDIHIALTAFARVRGRVVLNGEPIAGASVSVAQHGRPSTSTSVSQSDGSFVLDNVPYGTATFVAPPYQVRAPASVAIAVADVDGVELEVTRLATVHGHITRGGKPAAGATIGCSNGGRVHEHTTKADASGAYAIEGLIGGAIACTAWDPRDQAFTVSPPVQLGANADLTLDLDIDSNGRVQGEVVDEAGDPVPGADVVIDMITKGNDSCEAIADAHGAFDCGALAGGEYKVAVMATPGGRQPFSPASGDHFDTIQVPKDGVVGGVRLAIKNQRVAIRGTVADTTGAPVADAQVEALGHHASFVSFPSAVTDTDGHFEIANLAPGSYSVRARGADGGLAELTEVTAGGGPVTITIQAPGSIAGTLVGFAAPPVVRTSTWTSDLHLTSSAIVDGATFSATGLTPGHYTIEAQSSADTDSASVDVRSGETAQVTLTSHALGKVVGRVVEFGTNAPVAEMHCEGELPSAGSMGAAPDDDDRVSITDANGQFEVSAPVGRARVFCFLPGFGLTSLNSVMSPAGADVDVMAGAVASVELVSVRATYGAVRGRAGFGLAPMTLPLTVDRVEPQSPAAIAGVMSGDQLVTIDGVSVQGMLLQGVYNVVRDHAPGSTLVLGVQRGGVARTINIVLGE